MESKPPLNKHIPSEETFNERAPSDSESPSTNSTFEEEILTNAKSCSKDKIKYTPLEKQYLEFREKYPDTVLIVECGYKYRFFEKDAEIVSKLCNIGCYQSHNFLSATIPVPRLHFYVKQLVTKGYKVGVIKQTESTALKAASERRNDLFSRQMDAIYTKSTLIGEEFISASSDDVQGTSVSENSDMEPGYLVSVFESLPVSANQDYSIAIVGVRVAAGDIVYASFGDSLVRNNLETHLMHIDPVEILIPSKLSKTTERLINNFSIERSVRIEKIPNFHFDSSSSLNHVIEFCIPENSNKESAEAQETKQLILTFSEPLLHCLSALITYLSSFNLENVFKNLKNIQIFSPREHIIISGTTLKGLEILQSNSLAPDRGTLFWVLNKTSTKFGERLLKLWIAKPLKDMKLIEERLNIVTEILFSESIVFKVLEKSLNKLPDLERILSCIFHHKCSCFDFLKLLQSFTKIRSELLSIGEKVSSEIDVPRLKVILHDIPELFDDAEKFLSNLDPVAAKNEDKTSVFRDISNYPEMKNCKDEIVKAEEKLDSLRPEICKTLKLINFKYGTVAGQKYLIEVRNSHLSLVPTEWLKISSTKQVSRFKSPEILKLCSEIDQQKELMFHHASDAWTQFLNDFVGSFYKHKRAISHLAELDCYLSLAKVAKDENYCRPYISDAKEAIFDIKQGRHPIITKIMKDENQFVANDLTLNNHCRCMIVTGPNMGGKSTYTRQTALIAIMAHIGSYVPAEFASIPLFDGIFVRMGAEDVLIQGRSTFMVEMSETSDILSNATAKSFVILDELGRGTSTNDGTAIAYATLEYLVSKVRCYTMFVTHYPAIVELKNCFPENISVVHMGYILKDSTQDGDLETVTFLYNVVSGVSNKSYGINVAALAGIQREILLEAQQKSRILDLQSSIQRRLKNLVQRCQSKSS